MAEETKPTTTRREAVDPASALFGEWLPIETMDKTRLQMVLVYDDGAIRLFLWDNARQQWEHLHKIGAVVGEFEMCSTPTHWMPLPKGKPNDKVEQPPGSATLTTRKPI